MEYDLAMNRQDVKSGLYKTVGAIEIRTYFCSLGLGVFLYSKRANSYFLSQLSLPVTLYDVELFLNTKS